ncbi:hypothetical protein Y032_0046g1406 [Ancylostoma ceylanicum]|uniref:Uncharacterized protein n=1 Tax=Ancylostoma ceylanicum TaxID=53326 RepID=A0A016UBQ1_9BILA|nr:hypothetical protein Y032_0046g1406 [Ancylostoma ceylanicum]
MQGLLRTDVLYRFSSSSQGARAFPRLPFLGYGSSQDARALGSLSHAAAVYIPSAPSIGFTLSTLSSIAIHRYNSAQPQWPNGPADEDAVLPSSRMFYSPSSLPPEVHVEPL